MKNWSLSKKIWSILGILSVSFVVSTGFGLYKLSDVRDQMNDVTGPVFKRRQYANNLRLNQRQITILAAESLLNESPDHVADNNAEFDKNLEDQEKQFTGYHEIASETGRALLKDYTDVWAQYIAELKKARDLHSADKKAEALVSYTHAREDLAVKMTKTLMELNSLMDKQLNERVEKANADANMAITMSMLVAAVSILFSLVLAFLVLRAVTRAISAVVKNLSDSSIQVSGAATQIASSSEELSQAATEQAASLEETAASVEEMNSMVAKNSENANSASQTSAKSQESVSHGKTVVQKMIEAMEAINRSSEGMAETVRVIEQIDKKTKVINEIVNKTELLSFNASVEAARAGEHGKGFAVVAEEVGNLARMSGAAAEEIASLLEESINKVNQMVADTKKNVEMGANVTRECGEVFEDVVQNVNSVSGMAIEIASASQEQSRGCVEITKAMNQLDQMTQQNAATSEECASAAEQLSAQAESLKNAVSQLVSTVNGGGTTAHEFTVAPVQASRKQSHNLVHLKPKMTAAPVAVAPMKRASGDAPSYDNQGFTDI